MTLLDETSFYPAFIRDLASAETRVVLFTPYIGKTRWPVIAPHIDSLRARGVEVVLLHKPLTDAAWRDGDPTFGSTVFRTLDEAGVRRIGVSGIHAKTILIDEAIVYDGSLNWASHTSTREHMWRTGSRDAAVLVERMLQLDSYVGSTPLDEGRCPHCDGPLLLVNQNEKANRRFRDTQPLKAACYTHAVDKKQCRGYIRRIDGREPYLEPPRCPRGEPMDLEYSSSGKPWSWRCGHPSCRRVRWANGDVVP